MTGKELPQLADNLKLVNGIGPAIERRLYEANVLTFAQLAALPPDDVAKLVEGMAGMSVERIVQQDWIGQARKLAPEAAPDQSGHKVLPSTNRQHYATFTIELLLDEENNVRRTRVVHIQDGDEDAWAGWEEGRMVEFVTRCAALRVPPSPVDADSTLRLGGMGAVLPGTDAPCRILCHSQPFKVRLTLDLTDVAVPGERPINYTAAVYAKNLSGGARQTVGEARGSITPQDQVTITMRGMPLPQGVYRLQAVATLSLSPSRPDIAAHLEGNLLKIY